MLIPTLRINQKPTYITFAQDLDFYSLFQQIEAVADTCFLLESLGDDNHQSRYSIIGFNPKYIIRAKGINLHINDKLYISKNPYYALRDMMPQQTISRLYAGGLVGYLGYDVVNYFESKIKIKTHDQYDQFNFGVYTDGIIHDKMTNEAIYFYYNENRLSFIKEVMKNKIKNYQVKVKKIRESMTKEEHAQVVEQVKEHILSGDTFQCQVGLKMEYEISGDTLQIYSKLREINPSPYMYYMKMKDKKIIGASPELLFRLRSGIMETFPLAGTIRRGNNSIEDMQLARKLLQDPKEIAEHNMLIDLHRNDIGRVADFGTVKVRSLMDIKKFSHVQHISSEIVGIINQKEDMFTALASNFPAGTLSGAPKIESMKIIDRYETEPRGPYGGAIGHFGFNGDCTFAIPIRTLFISGTKGFIQASGGIVYDSTAENEYDELQRKMRAFRIILEEQI
ncbi:MAG: anthranilate synthase component I family protein [Candidatus Roizmanbacteria bacterium]